MNGPGKRKPRAKIQTLFILVYRSVLDIKSMITKLQLVESQMLGTVHESRGAGRELPKEGK